MTQHTPERPQTAMDLVKLRRPLDMRRVTQDFEELTPSLTNYLENAFGGPLDEHRLAFAAALAKVLEQDNLDSRVAVIETLLFAIEQVSLQAAQETVDGSAATTLTRSY